MAGFNNAPIIERLAVPSVCLLIFFLGYVSQVILHFSSLEPGPPSRLESCIFNILLLCLYFTFFRTVSVDPGRYVFGTRNPRSDGRWCDQCVAPKPLRAHHCRHCERCIPKMDHHCPWTRNCVSLTTFPHFLRFLFFSNICLWTLARLLSQRLYSLWEARKLPAYLGPSIPTLVALASMSLICLPTIFGLGAIFLTTLKSWMVNRTIIEDWELRRHNGLVDRKPSDIWSFAGSEDKKRLFERVEFPYDIGFFSNMSQAMGTSNPFSWVSPFAGNPYISSDSKGCGWVWEENGYNYRKGMWPPVDSFNMRGHSDFKIKSSAVAS